MVRHFVSHWMSQIEVLLFQAAGYGFGLISGTFAIVNVLSDMSGPGTIGIYGHSPDFFIATGNFHWIYLNCSVFRYLAFLTLCIILLNTCWGVIFFTSLDKGGIHRFLGPAVVVLSHMLFSCLVSHSTVRLLLLPFLHSSRLYSIVVSRRSIQRRWLVVMFSYLAWLFTRWFYAASV